MGLREGSLQRPRPRVKPRRRVVLHRRGRVRSGRQRGRRARVDISNLLRPVHRQRRAVHGREHADGAFVRVSRRRRGEGSGQRHRVVRGGHEHDLLGVLLSAAGTNLGRVHVRRRRRRRRARGVPYPDGVGDDVLVQSPRGGAHRPRRRGSGELDLPRRRRRVLGVAEIRDRERGVIPQGGVDVDILLLPRHRRVDVRAVVVVE